MSNLFLSGRSSLSSQGLVFFVIHYEHFLQLWDTYALSKFETPFNLEHKCNTQEMVAT